MRSCLIRFAVCICWLVAVNLVLAGPMTREEAARQSQVFEQLEKSIAEEPANANKFAQIARVMTTERSVDLRRRILDLATQIPSPELETFLIGVLAKDEDAGLRSQAATTLGLNGSERCLAALADAARNDRTTSIQIGDIGGQSSARRAATFAIAELAGRFPKIADAAVEKLRALPVADDMKDNDSLADARVQALFQVTRDPDFLNPFFARLNSQDARTRERGVVAFRFLKLKQAPKELVNTLKDLDIDVRQWTALILGEIGDPQSGAALMAVASDLKEEDAIRINAIYSLGHMKAAAAADLMEKLLNDPNPTVQMNAAIALFRMTGKKVKQLPDKYNAN